MKLFSRNDYKALAVFGAVGLATAFVLGAVTGWSTWLCSVAAFIVGWVVEIGFRRMVLGERDVYI